MKVCFICTNFPPIRCGVGDYTSHLARELIKRGDKVSVITSRKSEIAEKRYAQMVIIPAIRRWNTALFQLYHLITQINPDVVIIQYVPTSFNKYGLALSIGMLPFILRFALRKPVIVTFHELYIGWTRSPLEICMGLIQRFLVFFLLAGSNHAVVTTSARKRQLIAFCSWKKKKIHKIPVGSNIDVIDTSKKEKELFRQQITGADELLLGTFGTLHPERDFESIFYALSGLNNKTKMLCIGDIDKSDSQYVQLRDLAQTLDISDRVIWTGMCSAEKVSRYLTAIDVYIHSFSEISPRSTTLITAMAHGLPIIAIGGELDDWFVNSESMIFLSRGDMLSLIKTIGKLACLSERQKLGQKAREFYQQNFSWPKIAQQMTMLCSESISATQHLSK